MIKYGEPTEIIETLYGIYSGFVYSNGEPSQKVILVGIAKSVEDAESYVMNYGRESVFGPETPVTYCIFEYAGPPF